MSFLIRVGNTFSPFHTCIKSNVSKIQEAEVAVLVKRHLSGPDHLLKNACFLEDFYKRGDIVLIEDDTDKLLSNSEFKYTSKKMDFSGWDIPYVNPNYQTSGKYGGLFDEALALSKKKWPSPEWESFTAKICQFLRENRHHITQEACEDLLDGAIASSKPEKCRNFALIPDDQRSEAALDLLQNYVQPLLIHLLVEEVDGKLKKRIKSMIRKIEVGLLLHKRVIVICGIGLATLSPNSSANTRRSVEELYAFLHRKKFVILDPSQTKIPHWKMHFKLGLSALLNKMRSFRLGLSK